MTVTGSAPSETLLIGRVVGAFAVRGWLKVTSYTAPPENIINYRPWLIDVNGWQRFEVIDSRHDGRRALAQLRGVADRTAAQRLIGAAIAIDENQLPALADDEFYWRQLIGLSVINRQGETLGRVSGLLETGSHDALEVCGADGVCLIPFVRPQYVKNIDIQAGELLVDWQREWS